MKADMEFVSLNARIPYRCCKCAECCRHVEDSLMLEPLDVFNLTRFLMEQDASVTGAENMLGHYTHPAILEGYPIFQINTTGTDCSCVFLKDGKCSVYEARPQVCRMYPFGTAPGDRGRDFRYYLCKEQAHHFGIGSVKVKDWLSGNLSKEAREFYKEEYKVLPEIGKAIKKAGKEGFPGIAFRILYYLYYGYDHTKPFLPQYHSNMAALLESLSEEMGELQSCMP